MKAGTRVRIVSIHKEDAFAEDAAELVGKTAVVAGSGKLHKYPDKRHYAGYLTVDGYINYPINFYKVKLERL